MSNKLSISSLTKKASGINHFMITIRQADPKDLEKIITLFITTIENICSQDYGPDQIAVWTNPRHEKTKWALKIKDQYFIVAEADEKIVGFASMEKNYLDFMYVHYQFLRRGIATQLLKNLENEAQKNKVQLLTSDVSITAKPFFQQHGFMEVKKNNLIRKGVEIVNFTMQKNLISI